MGKFVKEIMVVRTPEQKIKGKEVLPPMAKSQEDGITILLGLKDYKVGEVVKTSAKGKEKRCPYP